MARPQPSLASDGAGMARTEAVPSSAIDAAVRVVLKAMIEVVCGVGGVSFPDDHTISGFRI